VNWVVIWGTEASSSIQGSYSLIKHVLLLFGVGVVDESGIVVIILSWLKMRVVNYKSNKQNKGYLLNLLKFLALKIFVF